MCAEALLDFPSLYSCFHQPITSLDCGQKCAPYNQGAVPFCCDTRHAVPIAYHAEWAYLQSHTDLWHLWQPPQPTEAARLQAQTPEGQVLIECQGYQRCQRMYRSITCRAFPFFPYLSREGELLGLSYYWDFEDRCWVISHLESVSPQFISEFIATYEAIFQAHPTELAAFRHHATIMRRVFGRRKRTILLLHRRGGIYRISPGTGRLRKVKPGTTPKFGPYLIGSKLSFPDEIPAGQVPE